MLLLKKTPKPEHVTLTLDQTLCSFWKGLEENVRGSLQLRGKLSWEAEHRWFLLCSSLNTVPCGDVGDGNSLN